MYKDVINIYTILQTIKFYQYKYINIYVNIYDHKYYGNK